jgi:hypothetical protein
LDLVGGEGPLELSIDGGPMIALANDRQPAAAGLHDGVHMALVRSRGAPPNIFLVGRDQPLPWLWGLAPASIAVGLVLVGALVMRALAERSQR